MDKILLFIPMYNCEKQIVRVLGQIDNEVLEYVQEIIVVNNISTDNSEQAAVEYCNSHPELPAKVLRNNENYGLGGSHKVAFEYAIEQGYDYVIVLHGDDQGRINDLIPLLKNKEYQNHDCCLGSRFLKGSKLIGYNKIRIFGNHCFNLLFTVVTGRKIKDLGSGLNMYKVSALSNHYYLKYPDTLYFNAVMLLSSVYYKHDMYFFPITWREEDQVSNMKMWNLSSNLLKMLFKFTFGRTKYITGDMRQKEVEKYGAEVMNK